MADLDSDEDALFQSAVEHQGVANLNIEEKPHSSSEISNCEEKLLIQTHTVKVTNPEKRIISKDQFIVFELTISGPTYNSTHHRRFNDFRNFHSCLGDAYPYNFLPALPTKGQLIGPDRFSSKFVEKRRLFLDRYIKNIASHPVLSKSKVFIDFLTKNDWKTDHAHVKTSVFDKMSTSLSQAFSNKQREKDFNDIFNYVSLYEDRVSHCQRVTNRVHDETMDAVHFASILPEKIKNLSDTETDDAIKAFLKDFCKIYEETPKCYESLHQFLSKDFQCYLEEEIRNCNEVKLSMRSRDKLQYELEDIKSGQLAAEAKLARHWEIDSVTKAKAEFDSEALKSKAADFVKKKATADNTIKNELLRWNAIKAEKMKNSFKKLADENIKANNEQIKLLENFLKAVEQQ